MTTFAIPHSLLIKYTLQLYRATTYPFYFMPPNYEGSDGDDMSMDMSYSLVDGDSNRESGYLPDELLLEILFYFPPSPASQSDLYRFCLVSQQWYDVGISRLYEHPILVGSAYQLFVRTICPSINAHIRKSELASLVRTLDLGNIVHQGSKSVTARLLGRTKTSLGHFVAPQASFAINCWAALSKCSRLKYLDLSLVSESISYQSLAQTLRSLSNLTDLFLPRCSSAHDSDSDALNIRWPPKLQRLHLSGSVHGKFVLDLGQHPENFPPTLTHLSISHAPKIIAEELLYLLQSLGGQLLSLEITHLPRLSEGSLDSVLTVCSHLTHLVIAIDYISFELGEQQPHWGAHMWEQSLPLDSLTILTSGHHHPESVSYFAPADLWEMVDKRYFGRLRHIRVAESTGWRNGEFADEWEMLFDVLVELDQENFVMKRWHYAGDIGEGMTYEEWRKTKQGQDMAPDMGLLAG
jgi:F-box-like